MSFQRLSKYALQNICQMFSVPDQVILVRRLCTLADTAVFESLKATIAHLDACLFELNEFLARVDLKKEAAVLKRVQAQRQQIKVAFIAEQVEWSSFMLTAA